MEKKHGINTKLLHDYPVLCPYTGASSIPKYQASTFDQRDKYKDSKKYCYSRFLNPTIDMLQKAIAKLENAHFGFAFSSGMSAITTALMATLKYGMHVIFPKEVYGGTYQFASEILTEHGVEVSFVDYENIDNIKNEIKRNTKVIYIETPSNPLLKVSDIKKILKLAKENNILTISDNTFMTSLYQKPLDMGCDIVAESITKFINGHSDVVGGLLATNDKQLAEKIELYQKNFGGIPGVEDAWLVLRGIKTMGLRMEKSVKNAELIANYLEKHPKIKKVYYPKSSQVHNLQATSGGAVLSFEFYNMQDMNNFIDKIEIPIYAVSLGGVESILSHPATMSHACMSKEERLSQGIRDELLRLSCGIEDIEDLLFDLEQGLK